MNWTPQSGSDQGLLVREYRGAMNQVKKSLNDWKKELGGGDMAEAVTDPYFKRISIIQEEVKRRVGVKT
jgi:hypothetical protein